SALHVRVTRSPYFSRLSSARRPTSSLFPYTTLFRSHQEVSSYIDTIPDQNQEQLYQQYRRLIEDSGKKSIKNILKGLAPERYLLDRKSTRLNSSHVSISYAVLCLRKKNVDDQYAERL